MIICKPLIVIVIVPYLDNRVHYFNKFDWHLDYPTTLVQVAHRTDCISVLKIFSIAFMCTSQSTHYVAVCAQHSSVAWAIIFMWYSVTSLIGALLFACPWCLTVSVASSHTSQRTQFVSVIKPVCFVYSTFTGNTATLVTTAINMTHSHQGYCVRQIIMLLPNYCVLSYG